MSGQLPNYGNVVCDDGTEGPQMLWMIGPRVARLLHGWEVTPKNLGMYASGSQSVRWELTARGSLEELSEAVRDACTALVATPALHQPQIKPRWRDMSNYGLVPAPKASGKKCAIL